MRFLILNFILITLSLLKGHPVQAVDVVEWAMASEPLRRGEWSPLLVSSNLWLSSQDEPEPVKIPLEPTLNLSCTVKKISIHGLEPHPSITKFGALAYCCCCCCYSQIKVAHDVQLKDSEFKSEDRCEWIKFYWTCKDKCFKKELFSLVNTSL